MQSRSLLVGMLLAALICVNHLTAPAQTSDQTSQDGPPLLDIKANSEQISFTVKKEFQPAVAEIRLVIVTADEQKVFETAGRGDQTLAWPLRDVRARRFLFVLRFSDAAGNDSFNSGKLMPIRGAIRAGARW